MARFYLCLYCQPTKWQPATKCTAHMKFHAQCGDDIGVPKVPKTYQELVSRWGEMGLLEEKDE